MCEVKKEPTLLFYCCYYSYYDVPQVITCLSLHVAWLVYSGPGTLIPWGGPRAKMYRPPSNSTSDTHGFTTITWKFMIPISKRKLYPFKICRLLKCLLVELIHLHLILDMKYNKITKPHGKATANTFITYWLVLAVNLLHLWWYQYLLVIIIHSNQSIKSQFPEKANPTKRTLYIENFNVQWQTTDDLFRLWLFW